LRHASAGGRLSSRSLDHARRLDRVGRADARLLPEALSGYAIERVVASAHARCVETVRALALARGLRVELRDELAPDAALTDTLALLDELPDAALVCTHREIVERLFDGDVTCEKGAAWLLERSDAGWRPTAYLPSPTSTDRARLGTAFV
ncbi:MAG TPA: histidine phosphatase family protein, partial [Gaiellaceae bacterium]|nr:histidine phosphatase family protein [Gaiellaceae bacterium]